MYIGLIGFNSIEYIEKILDIWNEGNCVVLLDVDLPYSSLLFFLNEFSISKCFVDDKYADINMLSNNEKIILFPFHSTYRETKYVPATIYRKYKPSFSKDNAIVVFSSGTTGNYKGIILSHYAISTNADMIAASMELNDNDGLYIVKKLSHSSTIVGELLVALRRGIKILIGSNALIPRIIFSNINEYMISIICINPSILSLFNRYLQSNTNIYASLKKIFVSGDLLNEASLNYIRQRLKQSSVFNMYGLSEAGPRVSMQNKYYCSKNSVGVPLNKVKIRIIDEQGCVCGVGKKGLIYVCSPSKFSGYISNRIMINDEWINTGDIGYFDKNGELYIVNRLNDLIIIDSHKVYPADVESTIMKCVNISNCAVFCKYNYVTKKSELVCAYEGDEISANKVIEVLRLHLINYEIPKKFIRVSTIPINSNGKRDMQLLKKRIDGD